MNWRRLLILGSLVLLGVAIVGALTPTEKPFDADSADHTVSAGGAPTGNMVQAALPRTKHVRAQVGDVVSLTVRVSASDVVEVPGLALQTPVDPAEPAQIVFVADRPGLFPVRLRYAGDAVGTVRLDG